MEISADPDTHSVAPGLGLHCLFRPVPILRVNLVMHIVSVTAAADDILSYSFLFFQEKKVLHFI